MSKRYTYKTASEKQEEQSDKPKVTDEELREYRTLFSLLDKDHGGSISKDELGELMHTLHIPIVPGELDKIIAEVDKDGSGEIDLEEFIKIMSKRITIPYSSSEVKNAFKVFQVATNAPPGQVNVEDLVHILRTYSINQGLTDTDIRDLLQQMDPNSEGYSNYSVYVDMMMGTKPNESNSNNSSSKKKSNNSGSTKNTKNTSTPSVRK